MGRAARIMTKYLRIRSYKMGPIPHCVLVLIGYRIDLLIFVPTNGIVPLLPMKWN